MTPADLREIIVRIELRTPLLDIVEVPFGWGPPKYYSDQRAHWIGWLDNHQDRGTTDAGKVYDRLQSVAMLMWLAEAGGTPYALLFRAFQDARDGIQSPRRPQLECAAYRRVIPWRTILEHIR